MTRTLTPLQWARQLISMRVNLANRMKTRNPVPVFVTEEWLADRIARGYCEVTGIPFDFTHISGQGMGANPFAPSWDRINPNLPYTADNIQVTVQIYNFARGRFSEDAYRTLIAREAVRYGLAQGKEARAI